MCSKRKPPPAIKTLMLTLAREAGVPLFALYKSYLKRTLSTFFNPDVLSIGVLEHYWGKSGFLPEHVSICNSGMMARLESALWEVSGGTISFTLEAKLRRDESVYKIYDSRLRKNLLSVHHQQKHPHRTLRFALSRGGENARRKAAKIENCLIIERGVEQHATPNYKHTHLLKCGSRSFSIAEEGRGKQGSSFCYLRASRELTATASSSSATSIPSHVRRIETIEQLSSKEGTALFREWVCGSEGLIVCVHDGTDIPERLSSNSWNSALLEKPDCQRMIIVTLIRPTNNPSTMGGFVEDWSRTRVLLLTEGAFGVASDEVSKRVLKRRAAASQRSEEMKEGRASLMTSAVADDENAPPGEKKRDLNAENLWPCKCEICVNSVNQYWANMEYFGPQKQYKTPLDTFGLMKYLNVDTEENVSRVKTALNISLAAFDIEAYSVCPQEEEGDCVTAVGFTSDASVGRGNSLEGRQPLYCIGIAHGFEKEMQQQQQKVPSDTSNLSFRCFEVSERKDAREIVADFWKYVSNLQGKLYKRKLALLSPILEYCRKLEERHTLFWNSRGIDADVARKMGQSQLFGKLQARLNAIAKKLWIFAHNAAHYDLPSITPNLVVAIKEKCPRARIKMIKKGTSISKISVGGIIFADSIALTPFTSLKKFGEITGGFCQKGIFPHAYFTGPEKLQARTFPKDPAFFANLSDGIPATTAEIERGEQDFIAGGFPTLREYLLHYLKVTFLLREYVQCARNEDCFFSARLLRARHFMRQIF